MFFSVHPAANVLPISMSSYVCIARFNVQNSTVSLAKKCLWNSHLGTSDEII